MVKQLLFLILSALLLPISTLSNATIIHANFRSELAAIPITVPPFGDYETDVIIREGTIASGTLVFDTSLNGGLGAFLSPPIIHLQNYLFFNNDDMMGLHEQNEGWPVTPTNWAVDLDDSFLRIDFDESLILKLRAYRGMNQDSENRPFSVNGDVGGTHRLEWISIETESTIWNTSYSSDRISQTMLSVRTVPEPSTLQCLILSLMILSFTTRSRIGTCRGLPHSAA